MGRASTVDDPARFRRFLRLSDRLELAMYRGILPDDLDGLDGTGPDAALAARLWSVAQEALRVLEAEPPDPADIRAALSSLATLRGEIDLPWLARLQAAVHMKSGPCGFSEAYLILSREEQARPDGAIFLGLGHYLRGKPMPEPERARRRYVQAGLRGRPLGFVRACEISMELEEGWATLFNMLAALASGLLLRFLRPLAARQRF